MSRQHSPEVQRRRALKIHEQKRKLTGAPGPTRHERLLRRLRNLRYQARLREKKQKKAAY